ncbi:HemK2/MTQ2 family protein methyltransferase [Halomicrobium sp. HM KBTZ05]|uniref:HemK2/MTQ2 family protein methyltransferase n=1 Tax=Halomicrobium sp. HM KBTZ05 TaxID=3242663 RepID=UPI003558386E
MPGQPPTDDDGRPSLATQRDTETVYQPAEDSDLLARTARSHAAPGDRGLDVGTGSGYVAETLAEAGVDVVASDLNPDACREAAARGVAAVRADLLDPFRDDAFDLVTFNPPYLPTEPDKEWDDWMEHALSGGKDGRRLVDPFLEAVERVLAPGGRVFLLISSLTGIGDVQRYAHERGLAGEIVADEAHPYERLVVIRFESRDESPLP